VRNSSIYDQAGVSRFLQGLYNDAGEPVYPEGMEITAHSTGASFRNRVLAPRLLIIEFTLKALSDTGTAGKMLHLSLGPNYINEKKGSLQHVRILFDLEGGIKAHAKSIRDKLRKLEK